MNTWIESDEGRLINMYDPNLAEAYQEYLNSFFAKTLTKDDYPGAPEIGLWNIWNLNAIEFLPYTCYQFLTNWWCEDPETYLLEEEYDPNAPTLKELLAEKMNQK